MDAIGRSFRGTVILHWYSGSEKVLERAMAAGAYASVNTAMCEGKRFPSLLSRIPRDRILTETDGPFVGVDGRKAEPADVQGVVAALARLWGEDSGDVARLVYSNFARVLGPTRAASGAPSSEAFQAAAHRGRPIDTPA